jgi:hypothetical protein
MRRPVYHGTAGLGTAAFFLRFRKNGAKKVYRARNKGAVGTPAAYPVDKPQEATKTIRDKAKMYAHFCLSCIAANRNS